jgi:membrane-associated phospholipid phosphatase
MYALPNKNAFRETVFSLTCVLAIGYTIYPIVPVRGPLFVQSFDVSLDVYYVGWLKEQLMDKTRVLRDCFPSLHSAASLILLWSSWRHARLLFAVLAPIVLSIPIACVYLRYHWVTDVLAGIALVGIVAWLTQRFARTILTA